ncbi:hypothetical protein GCM10008997_37840 [Halomonas salifodinae]
MPTGVKVSPCDFSEFTAAYDAFRETTRHRDEITRELESNSKPVVFVEGDYDIRYLRKAAELLDKKELLESVQLKDAVGFGNLDKIWRAYNNSVSEVLLNKIVLLYDCDTNKQGAQKNRVYKRVVPAVEENPVEVGIENLFPSSTIEKIENENPQYIDFHEATTTRVRGSLVEIPASKSINKDEKGNMCNWLCEHGEEQDFIFFQSAFNIIEEIVNG